MMMYENVSSVLYIYLSESYADHQSHESDCLRALATLDGSRSCILLFVFSYCELVDRKVCSVSTSAVGVVGLIYGAG